MPRENFVKIEHRSAEYTTPTHDEVRLEYPHEGIQGHADNGRKTLAFYATADYLLRQQKHGLHIYPHPTACKPLA